MNKLSVSIILCAISALCFLTCVKDSAKKETTASTDFSVNYVKTATVTAYNEHADIQVLGIIQSDREAKPSFKTGGVIRQTNVREGDMVHKGQVLATLEMDEINAQVQQAEQALIKTDRDLQRVKNLYQDSVATLEQFQNVQTAYEMARRNADIARFNKNYSVIKAPIPGKVVKQFLHQGEITGPGIPVFYILGIGTSDWMIKAGLVDRDWARVNPGDSAEIVMDAYPGKVFKGYVSKKSSVGGNASGTFEVEIRFRDAAPELAAGLTAQVRIVVEDSKPFTLIPSEALVKSNGQLAYAYTIVDGKAKKLHLSIAKLLGDKVAISSGLEGIKEVITTGAMYLEDGDTVMK